MERLRHRDLKWVSRHVRRNLKVSHPLFFLPEKSVRFLLIVYKGPFWGALTAGEDALAVEEGAWWRAPNTFRTSFSTDHVDWGVVALLKDDPFCSIAADNSSILPRISLSTFPAELDAMFIPRDTFWRVNACCPQKSLRPRSAKNFSTNKNYSRTVKQFSTGENCSRSTKNNSRLVK